MRNSGRNRLLPIDVFLHSFSIIAFNSITKPKNNICANCHEMSQTAIKLIELMESKYRKKNLPPIEED